jgi:choline-sulfatase
MQLDYDEEVTFRSLEALRELARHPKDGPFFLCASYTHPHDPFVINEPWWDLYRDADIPPPAVPERSLNEHHPFNQWLQIHHRIPEFPPEPQWVHNARRAYFGMVSYFDHQVGRLIAELERLGLDDNTLICVTSDHGEMLGEQGMWFKRTFYEPSIRVPLVFAGAGVEAKGKSSSGTVSLLELFPTFLEIGQLADAEAVCHRLPGKSLAPELAGAPTTGSGEAIIEYFSEGVVQPMRGIIKDSIKLVTVHEEEPLLFDLKKDPNELNNEYSNPEYAERREELMTYLLDGYDPEEQRSKVLASQQNRHWIQEAFSKGNSPQWDAKPYFDGGKRYVRDFDAQESSKRKRL